jgi:flagellar basal body P-ring protein FlgI
MRRRGADCLVVVLKRGNARGANGQIIAVGSGELVSGQTGNGRNPTHNGRRQPSSGDTSRMMREYQVPICEGLGVKFPGPTRPFSIVARTPTFVCKVGSRTMNRRIAARRMKA